MPTAGNKRVSQLVELTSGEIQPNDLFLIIDATARESKKIRASELEIYLQGSGSTAVNSISSSYVPGNGVDGFVDLATTASFVTTASFAEFAKQVLNAISSSYATTASFALNGGNNTGSTSASYLIYTGSPNGTASYAMRSLLADVASTSNFLTYFGGNNGTASYAITTQTALQTKNAATASYLLGGVGASVATASYAYVAEVANSGNSTSSSFLIYSPNNGTASYAMAAKTFANIITDKGIYLANTQSTIEAQLDDVDILWSTNVVARTPIEAAGTIKIPFTSSTITNGTVYLSAIDKNTGFETVLDSTPITFNLSPSMGTYGNNDSGSVRQPFTLMGQANLYGSYLVFVSASNNIQIESTRTVRFNIASETDTFLVKTAPPMTFDVIPSNMVTFTFTSDDGGTFTDNQAGLLNTMSLNKKIYTLDAINQNISYIKYYWTLQNVTSSNFSNNPSLGFISGVPNSMSYLNCQNCGLSSFYTFESSSIDTLIFNNNQVSSLPKFPRSMSYIQCANNNLNSLNNLPISLSFLNCAYNNITTAPASLPYGLTTFIVDGNPSLLSFDFTDVPISLISMSANYCSVPLYPILPFSTSYISSISSSTDLSSLNTLTSNLVGNGIISGTIDIRGNGSNLTIISNMTTLQNSYGWNTLYDI